jgi:hypothetical protein
MTNNLELLAKYAIIQHALVSNIMWLNDDLQGSNVYAPYLKQACKAFNREAKIVVEKWYDKHLVNKEPKRENESEEEFLERNKTELTFNKILDAWEKLVEKLRFAEPEQIMLIIEALDALSKPTQNVVYKDELPQGFLVRQGKNGLWSLYREGVVNEFNNHTNIEYYHTPVQNIANENECYVMAFEYAHSLGLLNEKGGKNE